MNELPADIMAEEHLGDNNFVYQAICLIARLLGRVAHTGYAQHISAPRDDNILAVAIFFAAFHNISPKPPTHSQRFLINTVKLYSTKVYFFSQGAGRSW